MQDLCRACTGPVRALCGSCTGSEYKNHYFIQTKTANISLNTWPRTLILPPKCSEHCVEHFSCIQNYVKTLGNFRNLTLVGPRHRRRFVQNRTGPVQGPCRPRAVPVQNRGTYMSHPSLRLSVKLACEYFINFWTWTSWDNLLGCQF